MACKLAYFLFRKQMQKELNSVLCFKWLGTAMAEDDLSDLVAKAWYYSGQYHKIWGRWTHTDS